MSLCNKYINSNLWNPSLSPLNYRFSKQGKRIAIVHAATTVGFGFSRETIYTKTKHKR
jgi:hypothetical protein